MMVQTDPTSAIEQHLQLKIVLLSQKRGSSIVLASPAAAEIPKSRAKAKQHSCASPKIVPQGKKVCRDSIILCE